MASLPRGESEYPHLEILREPERGPERRRRRGLPGRPPVPDDRAQHGRTVAEETARAVQQASALRNRQGIAPSQLLVLEFNSVNVDLRKALEERFHAWVVDERKERSQGQDRYRFLVQFPDMTALQTFQEELELYQAEAIPTQTLPQKVDHAGPVEVAGYRAETDTTKALPPGLRRTFFDGLQHVGSPSREDRVGIRLREEGFPAQEPFYLDVDLWHPGDTDTARRILDTLRSLCQTHGGQLTEHVRTASLLLAKIRGPRTLAETLLDLDLVARVDLPPRLSGVYSRIFSDMTPPDPAVLPAEDDPLVCVVDSGVVAGHPLLVNWVIEERDFETGENTPVDLNGHGTAVAGLVVYGDVARCIERNEWQPKVRICSAKVLRHDPDTGNAVFPDEHRIEKTIEDATRYFATERGCRIFNLSVGSELEIYRGGRQFPWAEKLDEVARELDVVIVVSTGNRSDPPIPDQVHMREQFQQAVRDQLLNADQRVCNPATAALALTVGAIARSEALGHHQEDKGVTLRDAFAGAPAGAPAPFTRTGSGYTVDQTKAAIKPDVVHYGGNSALQTLAGGDPRWAKEHILLGEPTVRRETDGRFVGAVVGTSFACPHVSHAAAIAVVSLEAALGQPPSANLIRALVGSTAVVPSCGEDWLITAIPPGGGDEITDEITNEEKVLRLVGYGFCAEDDLIWSRANRVRLVAMDEIEEDKFHIYRVPVPEAFLTAQGRRGITVALAYDPPVRSSRREYVARTMWVEVLHGLTTEEVEAYRGRFSGDDPPQLPPGNVLDLRPTRTKVQWSTLQVRHGIWRNRNSPRLKTAAGDVEPALHIVIGCQQRFPTGLDPKQRYGLFSLSENS